MCLFDDLTCRLLRPHCDTHPRLEDADRAATPDEIQAAFALDLAQPSAKAHKYFTAEELKMFSVAELMSR